MVSPHSYKKHKVLVCPPPAPSAFFLPRSLCLAIWPWFVSRYPLGFLVSCLILNIEHLHPTPPHHHQFTMSRTVPPHLLGLSVKDPPLSGGQVLLPYIGLGEWLSHPAPCIKPGELLEIVDGISGLDVEEG